jgi:hypothetical protein
MAYPRTTPLRINLPSIACEVLDGEAVLINFEDGVYYSAPGTGGMILEQLADGACAAELVATAQCAYSGPADEIASAVEDFLETLLKEQLIVEAPAGAPRVQTDLASTSAGKAGLPRAPFSRPVLHKYEDLKDLLLLDPIHDTDKDGWPLAPA